MSNKTIRAQDAALQAVHDLCSDTYNSAMEFDSIIIALMEATIANMKSRRQVIQARCDDELQQLESDIAQMQEMRTNAHVGIRRITEIVGSDEPREDQFDEVSDTDL